MKQTLLLMYAVLSSLITAVGATDEETQKTLQELKEAIDGIKEEDPDDSKVEEISNRIKDLSSKFENSNKKKEFERLSNQVQVLQMEAVERRVSNHNKAKKNDAQAKKMDFAEIVNKQIEKKIDRAKISQILNVVTGEGNGEQTNVFSEVLFADEAPEDFLPKLMYLGLNDCSVPYEVSAGGALGHVRLAEKDDEAVTIGQVTLTSGELYKKLTLSYSAMKKNPALTNYRLKELPLRWRETLINAILYNGLTISNTSVITPVFRDTADNFINVTPLDAAPTLSDIITAAEFIKHNTGQYLVFACNKSTFNTIRSHQDAGNNTVFYTKEEITAKIEVDEIVISEAFDDNECLCFDLHRYGIVGSQSYETLTDYDISINGDVVEVVGLVGGNVIDLKAGFCLHTVSTLVTPVTPPAPVTHTVTLPAGTGYTAAFVAGSSSPAVAGSTVNFTVVAAGGYEINKVTDGTNTLTAVNSVYTINAIAADTTIVVVAALIGG